MNIQYIELDEEMDMPCLCDCGTWFDLNKGYNGYNNTVVCESCHDKIITISELEIDIEDLEMQKNKKRKIKALRKHLEILKSELPWSI